MFSDMIFFNIFVIQKEEYKNKYAYLCVRIG